MDFAIRRKIDEIYFAGISQKCSGNDKMSRDFVKVREKNSENARNFDVFAARRRRRRAAKTSTACSSACAACFRTRTGRSADCLRKVVYNIYQDLILILQSAKILIYFQNFCGSLNRIFRIFRNPIFFPSILENGRKNPILILARAARKFF